MTQINDIAFDFIQNVWLTSFQVTVMVSLTYWRTFFDRGLPAIISGGTRPAWGMIWGRYVRDDRDKACIS